MKIFKSHSSVKAKLLFLSLVLSLVVAVIPAQKASAYAYICNLSSPKTIGSWDLNGDGNNETVYQQKDTYGDPYPKITILDPNKGCFDYTTSYVFDVAPINLDSSPGFELVVTPTTDIMKPAGLIYVIDFTHNTDTPVSMGLEKNLSIGSFDIKYQYGYGYRDMNGDGAIDLVGIVPFFDSNNQFGLYHVGGQVKVYHHPNQSVATYNLPLWWGDIQSDPFNEYSYITHAVQIEQRDVGAYELVIYMETRCATNYCVYVDPSVSGIYYEVVGSEQNGTLTMTRTN